MAMGRCLLWGSVVLGVVECEVAAAAAAAVADVA